MKATYFEKLKKYRDFGFSVMPIKRKSKKAFIKWKEFQAKRPTKRQLKAWAEDYPDVNIAIITGKVSGVVVVDADSDRGMRLIKKIGLPKDTPTVLTNRGEHYYFRYPDYDVASRKIKKLGLDIQSDGSYVMAPPSEHPDGGTYKWKVDLVAELPELPKKLLRQLEKTIKQKADSDPFIMEPGMDVVDIAAARLPTCHRRFKSGLRLLCEKTDRAMISNSACCALSMGYSAGSPLPRLFIQ